MPCLKPSRPVRAIWCPVSLRLIARLLLPLMAASATAENSASAPLEEVIVTARKSEESLFLVPMSVQVVSGAQLEMADLSSLYALQYDVPGMVVASQGFFGAGLALRGVTTEGGGSLAVAPHMNGVYLGESSLALARMFDVDRVEVLKGPQGTMYGRNATGGAVNVVTRTAEDVFSASAEASYGSYDTTRVHGHVNVPGEAMDFRLAAVAAGGDGYIRNTEDDRRFAEQDYFGIRGSAHLRLVESVDVNVMAQHVEDDGATGELWLPNRDYLPDPDDIRLTTVTLANPYLETSNDFVGLDVRWETNAVSLRSITGYASNRTSGLDDCAGLPFLTGCVRGLEPSEYEQLTQEIRLGSASEVGRDWLLGLFLLDAHERSHFHQTVPFISPSPVNDYVATLDEQAYGVFGRVSQPIGERWRLTGELRFNWEKKRAEDVGAGIADDPGTVKNDGAWDNTVWRVDIEFQPRRTTLLYAGVATGFKSGGVTTQQLPDGSFDGYDPEHLIAYETGLKWRSADGGSSLLASAFYYDFKDLQVRTIAFLADRIVAVIDNAAAARIYGLDLSGSLDLGASLILSAGLVWMPERQFVDFETAATGQSLTGNVVSRAPEWSTTASATYDLNLHRYGTLQARLVCNYRSKYYFTKENLESESQAGFGLVDLYLRFEPPAGTWYAFVNGYNLTGSDYFTQAYIQSSPGYPTTWEAGVGVRL